MSAQISFTLSDSDLKKKFAQKIKKNGLSMKAVLQSFIREYVSNDYTMQLIRTPKTNSALREEQWDDTMMTAENKKQLAIAKEDFKNGVNIVSWEEMKQKHNF